jgi:hypothetical protein
MISPIDDIFQPGIQLLFLFSMITFLIMMKFPKWIDNNKNEILKFLSQNKILVYILAGCGVYHFFILPILFVHEFGGYEGYDYRTLFRDENEEPINKHILFRKDKHSTLEALQLVIEYMKKYGDKSTGTILGESLDLNDKERIKVLASKIDEV